MPTISTDRRRDVESGRFVAGCAPGPGRRRNLILAALRQALDGADDGPELRIAAEAILHFHEHFLTTGRRYAEQKSRDIARTLYDFSGTGEFRRKNGGKTVSRPESQSTDDHIASAVEPAVRAESDPKDPCD